MFLGLVSFLAGCSSVGLPGASFVSDAEIAGRVSSGIHAVAGSSVRLYAAGAAGTASPAEPLLSEPIASEADGTFKIPSGYRCASPDSVLYVVARGGTPEGVGNDNHSLSLMTLLGPCADLPSAGAVTVNEVTTLSSLASVSGYMASLSHLGADLRDASFLPATEQVHQFADIERGVAPGAVDAGYVAPTAKLNTLANILAQCNASAGGSAGDGSPCGRLFSLATPTGGIAPADTASAALAVAQNPAANVQQLFALAQPEAPFEPALTDAPEDWAVALTPAAATPSVSASSVSQQATGGSTSTKTSGRLVVATAANSRGQLTYYVANSGNDSQSGTSTTQPWKTIGKVNSAIVAGLVHPGDKVLLKGGDIFRDDYIRLQNLVKVTKTTTLQSLPLAVSGTAGHPITISSYGTGQAILDGADPLSLKWLHLSGTTYKAQIATIPAKLYVDCPVSDCPQLLPVPNARGVWSETVAYNFLDMVAASNGGAAFVSGMTSVMPLAQHPGEFGNTWIGISNPATLSNEGTVAGTQTFPASNTGLQNVEAIGNGSVRVAFAGGTGYDNSTPFTSTGGGAHCVVTGRLSATAGVPAGITYTQNHGCTTIPTIVLNSANGTGVVLQPTVNGGSWYIVGNPGSYTIYVNLADGSDPSQHTFEGTHRPYGVLMASVNYVTIDNLAIEHTQKSGIVAHAFSDSYAGYYSNEYNIFTNNSIWNYGDILQNDVIPQQSYYQGIEGGIAITGSGNINPHLLRGISVSHNTIGTMDTYFGLRGQLCAGLILSGIDGGGRANDLIASYDVIATINAEGIQYGTIGAHKSGTYLNNGGAIAYETLRNNQGNIFFGGTAGGRLHHNLITNSFGEGIQLGGSSTSTPDAPQVLDHNVIANLGQSASTALYNGIDCNGSAPNVYEINNTIYNTNSAGPTFEAGCAGSHLHNNIVDQNANNYQPGTAADGMPNTSYTVYFVPGSNVGVDWSHNLWTPGANTSVPFFGNSLRFNCSTMFKAMPDIGSSCVTSPLFTNPSFLVNDFSLAKGSPAIGFGVSESVDAPFATRDAGAIPYGQKKLF